MSFAQRKEVYISLFMDKMVIDKKVGARAPLTCNHLKRYRFLLFSKQPFLSAADYFKHYSYFFSCYFA